MQYELESGKIMPYKEIFTGIELPTLSLEKTEGMIFCDCGFVCSITAFD